MVLTTAEPTTLAHWTDLAADVTPRTGVFIDGQFRDAQSGETFESINPATGELLARVASAQDADVDAAVASAPRGLRIRRMGQNIGRRTQTGTDPAG